MATFNVTVSYVNGAVSMTNNGNVSCNSNDTVQWIPDRTVSSIDSIVDNSSTNVFSSGPSRVANSNNWSGTVKVVTAYTEETYTISVTAAATSEKVSHDPKISVNP